LDDVKSHKEENNAAKTIALEHLGVIAARLRSSMLKYKSPNPGCDQKSCLTPLDEVLLSPCLSADLVNLPIQIVPSADTRILEKLLSTHQDVATHLCKRSSEDQAYDVSFAERTN
jgi:cohesin loading factor subunit SCC2